MVYFIDGPQLAGKSSLVTFLAEKSFLFSKYKFDFGTYSKLFHLRSLEEIRGFQLGKDLATLYYLSELELSENSRTHSLIDRGPMSTVYYSLLLGRMTFSEVEDFFKVLRGYGNQFEYIFITAKGKPNQIRNKEDNFNLLQEPAKTDFTVLDQLTDLANKYGIVLKKFENDFNQTVEKNSLRLRGLLI